MDLSRHDKIIIKAYEVGFRFDFDTLEMVRPSGKRRDLSNYSGKQRYPTDGFSFDGEHLTFKVHRFVAYQKFGECLFEEGIVVRHLNDIKCDLSFDNIVLGTISDNSRDIPIDKRKQISKYARSFQKRPSQCNTDDETVKIILKEFLKETEGLSRTPWGLNTRLANKFGKTKSAIESIVYGKSFKDVYKEVIGEIK